MHDITVAIDRELFSTGVFLVTSFNLFMLVKLAEIPLLFEELVVMMPAVESMFVRYVVRWANHTPSM